MGYTHYWKQRRNFTKTAWATIVEDVNAILTYATTEAGIVLADGDGKGGTSPSYTADDLSFNGLGEDAHETFWIDRIRTKTWEGGTLGGGFCKTARKPYDVVVVAVLCYLATVAESHSVESDGHGRDYLAGLDLARKALPRYANILDIPRGVMEDDRWIPPFMNRFTDRYSFRFCVDGRAYIMDEKTGASFAFKDHVEAATWGDRHKLILSSSGFYDEARRKRLKREQDKLLRAMIDCAVLDPARQAKPPAYVRPDEMPPQGERLPYYYADFLTKEAC